MKATNRRIYRTKRHNNSWIFIAAIIFIVVLIISFCGFYVESKGWDAVPFADKLSFLPFVTLSEEDEKEEDEKGEDDVNGESDNNGGDNSQAPVNNGADENEAVNIPENNESTGDQEQHSAIDSDALAEGQNEANVNGDEVQGITEAEPQSTPTPEILSTPTPEPEATPEPTSEPEATPIPTPEPEATPTPTPEPLGTPEPPVIEDMQDASANQPGGDYILPASNSRHLTAEDLQGLTTAQLRIARNEIYARHGRIFTSADLKAYFSSKAWYTESIQPDQFPESLFNEFEKANIDLISQMEKLSQ